MITKQDERWSSVYDVGVEAVVSTYIVLYTSSVWYHLPPPTYFYHPPHIILHRHRHRETPAWYHDETFAAATATTATPTSIGKNDAHPFQSQRCLGVVMVSVSVRHSRLRATKTITYPQNSNQYSSLCWHRCCQQLLMERGTVRDRSESCRSGTYVRKRYQIHMLLGFDKFTPNKQLRQPYRWRDSITRRCTQNAGQNLCRWHLLVNWQYESCK